MVEVVVVFFTEFICKLLLRRLHARKDDSRRMVVCFVYFCRRHFKGKNEIVKWADANLVENFNNYISLLYFLPFFKFVFMCEIMYVLDTVSSVKLCVHLSIVT